MARAIESDGQRAEALSAVATILIEAGERAAARPLLDEAIAAARAIESDGQRAQALSAVAAALAQAGHRDEAIAAARAIEDDGQRAEALSAVAAALAQAGEIERNLALVQESWLHAATRPYALQLLAQAVSLIAVKPEIGIAFGMSFQWVADFFCTLP